MNDNQDRRKSSGHRVFRAHSPSPDDLEMARTLEKTDCPRRYCWWWASLSFEWDQTIEEGCTFLMARKPKGYRNAEAPCLRCDGSSEVDHYEPREPHLMEDGMEVDRFTNRPEGLSSE